MKGAIRDTHHLEILSKDGAIIGNPQPVPNNFPNRSPLISGVQTLKCSRREFNLISEHEWSRICDYSVTASTPS